MARVVVGAAVDDGLDEPERQVDGVGVTVTFRGDMLGQLSVVLTQFAARLVELGESRHPQLGQEVQRPQVPAVGTQLRDVGGDQ